MLNPPQWHLAPVDGWPVEGWILGSKEWFEKPETGARTIAGIRCCGEYPTL